MFIAKEINKTAKGNAYMILQDSPSTFHVSVSIGNVVSYDFLESPPTLEFIQQAIQTLETELEEKINTNQI